MGREFGGGNGDGGDKGGDGTHGAAVSFEGYDTTQSTHGDAQSQELVKSGILPPADSYLLLLQQAQALVDKSGAANPVTDSAPSDNAAKSSDSKSSSTADVSGENTVIAQRARQNLLPEPVDNGKMHIGGTEYGTDQVTAHDLGALIEKGIERIGQAAKHPELAEGEYPSENGDLNFPHRGREDEYIDYNACARASKTFPDLAKHLGDGPGKIDPDLVAAIIRNEQFHYKNILDTGPDHYIKTHGNWPFNQDESVSSAQIQVRNIDYLAKTFPKELGSPADAVRNAADVHRAPYFVAAYCADVIHGIETKQKPAYIAPQVWESVTRNWQVGRKNEALILAYNPHADQVNHVFTQLDNIKAPDWD